MNYLFIPGTDNPDHGSIGGKGRNLDRMTSVGLPVPSWFAVTTSAFNHAIKTSGISADIDKCLNKTNGDASGKAAARARKLISEMELPDDLAAEITAEYEKMSASVQHVAVRSSAADEDGSDQSFAGLHDSFLFVTGKEELLDAVKRVWASAYNERALSYRTSNGLPLDGIAVAVIVQEMVRADVSGVMFTCNPVTGNVKETVISSVYGAGEGLVSEGLDADTFTVSKETQSIEHSITEKTEMMVLDEEAGRGLKRVPVPEADRKKASLRDSQVKLIADTGRNIENAYGRPQDIEFSIDQSGRLKVLQTRPVTTTGEYGPAAGNHLIWDNSNIIESYSGVTSPMTFSFIRRAYTIVYNCFCEVMGVPGKTIKANQSTFSNMLGLFRGQVYYNLLNWYRLIRLFPGFSYNKEFMESMMGVKEPAELKDEYPDPGFLARYFVELPRLLKLITRSTINFARIRKLTSAFDRHFKTHYRTWTEMDFDSRKPDELMNVYSDMEDKLLWNWKAPIINDFFVMIFYGTLKKLCLNWCDDRTGSLQNDLICGEGGIESTEPTKMLLKLASIAQKNSSLRDLIINKPSEELVDMVRQDSQFSEFSELMSEYLDLYGFRCMNELKLEEYSLKDRPQFVYTILRNYLRLDSPESLDIAAMETREKKIRKEAEHKAFQAVSAGRAGWLRGPVFRWVLKNARLGVKNRENMRFARTRIYGLLRELIRALGKQFAAEGVIGDKEDIFYLSLDECFDYIRGTAITTSLSELAELRKKEFEGFRNDEDNKPDDRFDTYGMAYNRNLFRDYGGIREPVEDGKLSGTGCCPGEVTGPVKVLRSPSDDMELSGEILVAERTDPGWVPLYPSVSGVLIERGSILSHSAIVAREMGIPTIVGIQGLTATLRTGQKVSMNGSSGLIEVLDAGNEDQT